MVNDSKRERQRELNKARYARLKADGTCVTCGRQPAAPDSIRCSQCLQKGAAAAKVSEKKRRHRRVTTAACTRCGSDLDTAAKTLCGKCKRAAREKINRLREQRAQAGLCLRCGNDPAQNETLCVTCGKKSRQHNQRNYQQLRHAAIMAYGGYRCACPGCNIDEPQFLQIDHINNDGAAHRRKIGRSTIYQWLKNNNYPPGFQVLCANCNFSKGHYGCCPHQDQTRAKRPTATTPNAVTSASPFTRPSATKAPGV